VSRLEQRHTDLEGLSTASVRVSAPNFRDGRYGAGTGPVGMGGGRHRQHRWLETGKALLPTKNRCALETRKQHGVDAPRTGLSKIDKC
jgi:hypothetical protein